MNITDMNNLELMDISDIEEEPLSTRQRSNKAYFKSDVGKYNNYRGCLLSTIRRFGRVPKESIVQKYDLKTSELLDAWTAYKQKVGSENVNEKQRLKMRLLVSNMF